MEMNISGRRRDTSGYIENMLVYKNALQTTDGFSVVKVCLSIAALAINAMHVAEPDWQQLEMNTKQPIVRSTIHAKEAIAHT